MQSCKLHADSLVKVLSIIFFVIINGEVVDDQRKRGLVRHDFFIGKAMEARASAFHCISFRSFKLISTNGCVGFTRSPCSHLIRCREIRCKSDRYDHSSAYNLESKGPAGFLTTTIKHLKSFYEFCRPHTIFGTVIGVTSVSLLPVKTVADISPLFFIGLLKFDFSPVTNFYISFYTAFLKSRKRRVVRDRLGEPAVKKQPLYRNETLTNWAVVVLGWVTLISALIPAVFMNIYVVGLNQIYDIEIDKVNKPNLPLASGELNIATGVTLVISFLIMSFYLGVKSGSPPLLGALVISFLLGSAYSIDHPLFRWKRHAFLAASCILCVRAILVQLAFYAHIQVYVLERPLAFTKSVIFATAFMCFFAVVIALFKDIPDVNGDKHFGIQSFSVRLGQKRVFWLCIELLLTAYTIAILVGVASSDIYRRIVTVIGHGILASVLLIRARCLDIENKSSITSFYMFIWKLFYAEYLLIPFVQ